MYLRDESSCHWSRMRYSSTAFYGWAAPAGGVKSHTIFFFTCHHVVQVSILFFFVFTFFFSFFSYFGCAACLSALIEGKYFGGSFLSPTTTSRYKLASDLVSWLKKTKKKTAWYTGSPFSDFFMMWYVRGLNWMLVCMYDMSVVFCAYVSLV